MHLESPNLSSYNCKQVELEMGEKDLERQKKRDRKGSRCAKVMQSHDSATPKQRAEPMCNIERMKTQEENEIEIEGALERKGREGTDYG